LILGFGPIIELFVVMYRLSRWIKCFIVISGKNKWLKNGFLSQKTITLFFATIAARFQGEIGGTLFAIVGNASPVLLFFFKKIRGK